MKRNPTSQSAFFNPRIFLAFILCSVGALLAMLSFAGPTGAAAPTTPDPGAFGPVVSTSVANGVSPVVRDLPVASPTARTFEEELRRVHPNHPVPAGFVDPAVQTSPGALTMPGPINTFEGQSADDSGCGCIPPDTNGAVGRTQYVQMVNSSFSVYSKTGTRLSGPTQINALWSGLPGACKDNNNGDPVVVYDQLADRWLVSQFAVPGGASGYHECIAISQTPDATGPYFAYDFFLSGSIFHDYPHFGLWPDAYYMSTHEFTSSYVGAGAFAFERAKMLLGQPAQMVFFDLGPINLAFGGHLPANLDGFTLPPTGAPNYFVEVDDSADIGPVDALRIWKFHVDWTTPSNSTFGLSGQPNSVVPVTDFTRPNCVNDVAGCVPQPGDETQLDPIGDRLMYRLAYRNFGDHEALVLNHTVVANSTTGQMGPRWYEVRDPGGTPTIFQQSTLAPTGPTDPLYRWMSSIAMDHSGDIAIGYSTSSNVNFPSIAWAGRLVGDTVNTLAQGEAQMFAGGGPQHATLFVPPTGRWGDYTDMTVDPSDDCTFWYTNEYFPAPTDFFTVWHTRVGNFKFPSCVPSTPPPGTPVMDPSGSSLVSESCFPGNGVIDPGEPVAVSLCVTNLGSANTTNLVGTLVATGGVTNPSPPQTYGVVTAVGAPVCRTFTFTAANQSCGSQITASLSLLDGGISNLGTLNYNFALGASVVDFGQNFDGVTAPALPAGWTAMNLVPPAGEPMWVTSTSDPDSPPNSAFASEPATPSDKRLESPAFLIPSTGGTLSFRHKFSFDPGFDGGVLEILIGSGQFTDWLTAGGTFTANGYNGTIPARFGNPIVPPDTSRQCWTNSSNGYITTTANFPASASGQMVQLRFRMGSDTLVGGAGWNVDGIKVNERFICCNGGAVSVVSRKTHGTGGPTFDINLPPIGTRGVEPRSGGATNDYKLVFTFPNNLTSVGSASVTAHNPTSGTGTVSGSAIGPGPNQYTVNVTNVSNAQYITVTLNSVLDATGASGNVVGPQMGVLLGDTSADGVVNSADITQTRRQSGNVANSSNFREEVTLDGVINSADITLVRRQSGNALPTPP